MNDLILELYYTSHEKSPYMYSKLISGFYFEHIDEDLRTEVTYSYDKIFTVVKACSQTIIANEENLLTDSQIAKIVRYFSKNVPMITFCIYIRAIGDEEYELFSIKKNKSIIYKIIVDAYNEVAESRYMVNHELNDEQFKTALGILL